MAGSSYQFHEGLLETRDCLDHLAVDCGIIWNTADDNLEGSQDANWVEEWVDLPTKTCWYISWLGCSLSPQTVRKKILELTKKIPSLQCYDS